MKLLEKIILRCKEIGQLVAKSTLSSVNHEILKWYTGFVMLNLIALVAMFKVKHDDVISIIFKMFHGKNISKMIEIEDLSTYLPFINFKINLIHFFEDFTFSTLPWFWAINAVLITAFTSIFFLKDEVVKKNNRTSLRSFALIFNLILYAICTVYLFYPFFLSGQLDPMRYTQIGFQYRNVHMTYGIAYFISLIYPYVIFSGFNKKFFVPLSDKKFFMFYLLTFTVYVGFMSAFFSESFISLFISLELQSFAFSILIAFVRNRVHYSILLSYILQLVICSAFMLFGIVILYATLHTLNFNEITTIFAHNGYSILSSNQKVYLTIGLFIFLFGVIGKSGGFPFFRWSFDMYPTLPLFLVFISAVVNKVGILVPALTAVKTCFWPFFAIGNPFILSLFIFNLVGLIFGSLYGLGVKNLRELLAASSVIQTSYIIFCIFFNYSKAEYISIDVVAIKLYIMGYIGALVVFFIFLAQIESKEVNLVETTNSKLEEDKTYNKIWVSFVGGLIVWTTFLIISGFPPFSFFVSKFTFLINIMTMLNLSYALSITLFISFVFASFLNMIIYSKFILKNLDANLDFSKSGERIFPNSFVLIYFVALIITSVVIYDFQFFSPSLRYAKRLV